MHEFLPWDWRQKAEGRRSKRSWISWPLTMTYCAEFLGTVGTGTATEGRRDRGKSLSLWFHFLSTMGILLLASLTPQVLCGSNAVTSHPVGRAPQTAQPERKLYAQLFYHPGHRRDQPEAGKYIYLCPFEKIRGKFNADTSEHDLIWKWDHYRCN